MSEMTTFLNILKTGTWQVPCFTWFFDLKGRQGTQKIGGMTMQQISKDNPYGKAGDLTTKQIIDRVLGQHFTSSSNRAKTIGEIQDEMLREMSTKVKVVDFGKGETCDFPSTQRC